MSTIETQEISTELLAEMQEVARLAMTGGVMDPELLRHIQERAERIRSEVFHEHGLLDIGTPSIRELRNDEES
jgi:hypothetical protein